MQTVICFKCQQVNQFTDRVGRRDECPKCRSDLHVCKNCVHYDPSAYNECREPQADYVQDRERANFCDYFLPNDKSKGTDAKKDLLSAAELLFKKK